MNNSVVALHGLTGHAWNTFTTSEVVDEQARWTRENNWLRDSLPGFLEQHHQQKIYSRVMSFGYNADVWMTKSNADLDVPVRDLLNFLEVERREVYLTYTYIFVILSKVSIPRDHYSLWGTV